MGSGGRASDHKLATAIASEAGQALAIGAIKIGTRRVYFSQKAVARARAGCWDMPLQTIGGYTYCHTPLHDFRPLRSRAPSFGSTWQLGSVSEPGPSVGCFPLTPW